MKYRLFKRGRLNNYSYIMAEKEDSRKCCETFVAYFKDRFIVLRCFYKQSIMEFTSFNVTLLIYYFAEFNFVNLLLMTPSFFETGYLNNGKVTVTRVAENSAISYLICHYIIRRINSLEVFSSTFDLLVDSSKNHKQWAAYLHKLVNNPELLKQLQDNIYDSTHVKFDLHTVTDDRAKWYKEIVKKLFESVLISLTLSRIS